MNHLISYKLFESSSEYNNMIQDIKDISEDLLDDNFRVKVYPHYSEDFFRVRVSNGYDFDVKYIKPVIDRMHECAKTYGYDGIMIGAVPVSQGSTNSEVLPGGFMVRIFKPESTVNESVFNWDFYKKYPDVPGITSDVLSELEDKFKTEVNPITYDLAYGAKDDVLQIKITPAIRITGYVFPFSQIKDTVVELISQLEGNGLKFYRYMILNLSGGNSTYNWCYGVKDILNNNITKNRIYGFRIEFSTTPYLKDKS